MYPAFSAVFTVFYYYCFAVICQTLNTTSLSAQQDTTSQLSAHTFKQSMWGRDWYRPMGTFLCHARHVLKLRPVVAKCTHLYTKHNLLLRLFCSNKSVAVCLMESSVLKALYRAGRLLPPTHTHLQHQWLWISAAFLCLQSSFMFAIEVFTVQRKECWFCLQRLWWEKVTNTSFTIV